MDTDGRVAKSVTFVCRGADILVFRHPLAGVQLPKGTVERNEAPDAAARREVFEEVGVTLTGPMTALGRWVCPSPRADWHVFVANAPANVREAWCHAPTGGGDEANLLFDVFWLDRARAQDVLHPLFLPVLAMFSQHARSG